MRTPLLRALLLAACLLAALVAPAPAAAQLAHSACASSYPPPGDARREGFNDLLEQAATRQVDLLILGSSIYTVGGNGGYAVAALNAEFGELYGNVPATAWMPVGASFGTSPPSQLGARVADSAGSAAPSGYASSYALPTFDVYKYTTWSGTSLQLEPNAFSAVPSEFGIPGAYFRTGAAQLYRPEWICTSYGGVSSEASSATTFGWHVLKRSTDISYAPWGAVFSGGTGGRTTLNQVTSVNIPATDLNGRAVTPNSATYDAWRLGCPTTNGAAPITYAHDASNPYYDFILEHGSGSGQFFAAAQRWVNTTTTNGIVVSSASKTGCKMDQVLADHGNAGPLLRAMRPEIVAIALHTNSAGNSYAAYDAGTPSNSYYHMGLALIDWVRTYLPNCWIVLIPDGPRTDLTSPQETQYSLMVGAHQMLADARPNVLAINLTYALEKAGYTKATQTFSGYTFKGLWATATSYAVGDIVSLDGGGEVRYARCLVAHTSGSTSKPFLGSGSSDVWRAHRRFLVANPDPTSTVNDAVHPGPWGARYAAKLAVHLMTEGLLNRPKPPRGRAERRRHPRPLARTTTRTPTRARTTLAQPRPGTPRGATRGV